MALTKRNWHNLHVEDCQCAAIHHLLLSLSCLKSLEGLEVVQINERQWQINIS